VHSFCRTLLPLPAAADIIRRNHLAAALKQLRSSFLDRALGGIRMLCFPMDSASAPLHADGTDETSPPTADNVWRQSAEELCRWVGEKRVLEEVFERHSHAEVFRAAEALVRFITVCGAPTLQQRLVDVLWGVSSGRHQSLQSAAQALLQLVAARLTDSSVQAHLLGQIRALGPARLSPSSIQLLSQLAVQMVQLGAADRPGEHGLTGPRSSQRFDGLQVLFEFAMAGEGALSLELRASCQQNLHCMVLWDQCAAQRAPLFAECLANLRAHRSVLPSMLLMDALQHPEAPAAGKRKSPESFDTFGACSIEELLAAVLEDIEAFAADQAASRRAPVDGEPETLPSSGLDADAEARGRLEFLSLVIGTSALALSTAQTDRLWVAGKTLSSVPGQCDAGVLRWFRARVEEGCGLLLPMHLFSLVSGLDATALATEEALELLRACFAVADAGVQWAEGQRAAGVGRLWEISLAAEPIGAVAARAGALLCSVLAADRESFLESCLGHLHAAAREISPASMSGQDVASGAGVSEEGEARRFANALRLLKADYAAFSTGAPPAPHTASDGVRNLDAGSEMYLSEERAERLIALLDHPDVRVREPLWELLEQLPASARMQRAWMHMQVSWDDTVHSASLQLALCNLRIVRCLLGSQDGPSEKGAGFLAWLSIFCERDGPEHLVRKFFSSEQWVGPATEAAAHYRVMFLLIESLEILFSVVKADVPIVPHIERVVHGTMRVVQSLGTVARHGHVISVQGSLQEHNMAAVSGMRLLSTCMQQGLLPEIMCFPCLDTWLAETLLCHSPAIRQAVMNGIREWCGHGAVSLHERFQGLPNRNGASLQLDYPTAFFLERLLPLVPRICEAPFAGVDLVVVVVDLLAQCALDKEGAPQQMLAAMQRLEGIIRVSMLATLDAIQRRPQLETFSVHGDGGTVDYPLYAWLTVIDRALAAFPALLDAMEKPEKCCTSLTAVIVHTCLLGDEDTSVPTCRSLLSRQAALTLLLSVARALPGTAAEVCQLLARRVPASIARVLPRYYDPARECRARCGFVGLRNLGSTCYQNALLQQLFSANGFRRAVLETTPNAKDAGRLLLELQRVFWGLQESRWRSVDTERWCAANTDSAGQPIARDVQTDVDEYLNTLFHNLEGAAGEAIKASFGGALEHSITCPGLEVEVDGVAYGAARPFVKARLEQFCALQLDVKGAQDITQSLAAFVAPDVLDGDNRYLCEEAGRKVDAVKRVALQTLPRTLVLHLKRFEFQVEYQQLVKNNDFCSFPVRLDMSPYTADALSLSGVPRGEDRGNGAGSLADGSSWYRLAGVIVHVGTADSGHYYSLVRQGDQWVGLNDEEAYALPAGAVPEADCFGGYDHALHPDLQRSAYMIFYEREDVAGGTEGARAMGSTVAVEVGHSGAVPAAEGERLDVAAAPAAARELVAEVHAANARQNRELVEFDELQEHFLLAVLSDARAAEAEAESEADTPVTPAAESGTAAGAPGPGGVEDGGSPRDGSDVDVLLKAAFAYLLDTRIHLRTPGLQSAWGPLLRELLPAKQIAAHRSRWVLEAFAGRPGQVEGHRAFEEAGENVRGERSWLCKALVSNANTGDRALLRDLLAHAVRVVAQQDGWASLAIGALLDAARALLALTPRFLSSADALLELLLDIAGTEGGVEQLLARAVVAPLLDVYLFEDSPFFAETGWRGTTGNRVPKCYPPLIRLVARLVAYAAPRSGSAAGDAPSPEQRGALGVLSERCAARFWCPALAARLLEMDADEDVQRSLLIQMSWGDERLSDAIMRRLCEYATGLDAAPSGAERLVVALLELKDGLSALRVSALCTQLATVLSESLAYPEALLAALALLTGVVLQVPAFARDALLVLGSVAGEGEGAVGIAATLLHPSGDVRIAAGTLGGLVASECFQLEAPADRYDESDALLEQLVQLLAAAEDEERAAEHGNGEREQALAGRVADSVQL